MMRAQRQRHGESNHGLKRSRDHHRESVRRRKSDHGQERNPRRESAEEPRRQVSHEPVAIPEQRLSGPRRVESPGYQGGRAGVTGLSTLASGRPRSATDRRAG